MNAVLRLLLRALVRLLVGAYPKWSLSLRPGSQRIYFANHSSHLDTLAIITALPADDRNKTRPVAAADYWGASILTRRLSLGVLNAVLIDRARAQKSDDPLAPLIAALESGASLIIFPEGTRGSGEKLAPFKAGLYLLGKRFPQAELVPVYLDNLRRTMPKGSRIPVPFGCTVHFGEPMRVEENEDKAAFLTRAAAAVEQMA